MNLLGRWSPSFGLHRRDEERVEHCRALHELQGDPQLWREFAFWYDNLSILDAKSSSLLQFNSVILAAIAIIFALSQTGSVRYCLASVLGLSITSCLLCLAVAWIHWSATADLRDSEQQGLLLLQVRDRRTRLYRIAWWLAVLSLSGLVLGILLSLVFGGAG